MCPHLRICFVDVVIVLCSEVTLGRFSIPLIFASATWCIASSEAKHHGPRSTSMEVKEA